MEIDENFAKYILSLQSIATDMLERGLDENYDIPVRADADSFRDKLEEEFPKLKKERETNEFENWLITNKISNLPEIKTLTATIIHTQEKWDNLKENKKKLKEAYYKLFLDDPEIKKEYKLLKTIKKLSS
jgi:hypothetical protein|tara:strand:+ start:4310 stop:4699 length:390 start_codon:yes stop_codon:yes gene_type:complete